jgi:hypothetical protein
LYLSNVIEKNNKKTAFARGPFFSIKNMNITIINDCRDANAAGRQITRAASLLHGSVSFIGVANDLEAAGNIIDALDAFGESSGVVLANVAPRNGMAKRWENGTPFGYFWHKKILVLASIDGFTLSLVKKLRLAERINVLDAPSVLDQFVARGVCSQELYDLIARTQFRSFDFLPRAAAFLVRGTSLPSSQLSITSIPDAPQAVWWIDNFGNCKTTLLLEDIKNQNYIATRFGALPYFPRLKDVPDKTAAIITGSSGLGAQRFLELVVQGESAAKNFVISVGDLIFDV